METTKTFGAALRMATTAAVFVFAAWACWTGWSSGTSAARAEATYEDVVQLHQALAYYQQDQGTFPSAYQYQSQEILKLLYIAAMPTPQDVTGACAKYPSFQYELADSQSYSLKFCLNAAVQNLAPGMHTLSSSGVDQ
jgi:hypothetical protein